MRNPARIYRIVNLFARLWQMQPDSRFFQLIEWVNEMAKESFKKDDLFFVEDDDLKIFLDNLIKQQENKKQ